MRPPRLPRKPGCFPSARIFASRRLQGGTPFSRGQLHSLLTNPIYRGLIRHKDKTWPGLHPAIIDEELWNDVHAKLQVASGKRKGVFKADMPTSSAPLLGKFRDEASEHLTPTHTKRHGRRIRYYVSNGFVSSKPRKESRRLPAEQFEMAVADAIAVHLTHHAKSLSVLQSGSAREIEAASNAAHALSEATRAKGIAFIASAISGGSIRTRRLNLNLDAETMAAHLGIRTNGIAPDILTLSTTFTCRRRGMETKTIADDQALDPDQTLIRALCNAHRWANELKSGTPIKQIAADNACSGSYARRVVAAGNTFTQTTRSHSFRIAADGTDPGNAHSHAHPAGLGHAGNPLRPHKIVLPW